ncbi:MAG: nuclear transport factor 2 family protein [Proteobacteria bacterium]|nr:nuclear transport factor 2 family protein [Pseudomonadota bacterium]
MLNADIDRIVRAYLHAKDHQRPHRFSEAFAHDATFWTTFAFDTDWNSPEPVNGLAAISDTFRRLGAGFENIVTICLPETARWSDHTMHMRWVVLMTDRRTGAPRAAWGDYAWTFTPDGGRAQSLHVHMHKMIELEANEAPAVLEWGMGLPDVWCSGSDAAESLPEGLPGLAQFLLSPLNAEQAAK